MAADTTMDRYRRFVDDYNRGVGRADLCATYDVRPAQLDDFLAFLKRQGFHLAPPVTTGFARAHEIDFAIGGDELQYVAVELDPGETVVAEAGAMLYIDPAIQMETIFGDGSARSAGVMDKIFGAGKRILTGESLFMTAFTNRGTGKQRVAFSAPYPGKILAMDLAALGGELVCQKDAFLCAAKGVAIDIAFQRKLGAGLFGGEGFILERLRGDGYAFVHAGGTVLERDLAAGETLRIDTGCLVAMQNRVDYDIQFVGGIKTALFGGEGLFFATLTGPGRIWLQSLPFSRLAGRILAALPRSGGNRQGEGSLLGALGDAVMGSRR
jgi:uncharacterized protein (TIGR00266 family)